jgi:hypothetical protein
MEIITDNLNISTAVDTQVIDTSVEDTPVVDIPVVNTSVVHTPVVDTPVINTTVVDTTNVVTQNVDTQNIDTQVDNTSVVDTPNVDTLNVNTSVVNTPNVDTPNVDTLVIDNSNTNTLNIYNDTVRLILDVMGKDEKIKKYNINIDTKTNDIFIMIIKSNPLLFSDIEDTLIKIVKDGKIDLNDIPEILVLLKKLYEIIYGLKKTKKSVIDVAKITGDILKILVLILTKENKIKINNEEEFLKNVNELIDMAITLLSLNKNLKKSYGCNNFLKLFKKK